MYQFSGSLTDIAAQIGQKFGHIIQKQCQEFQDELKELKVILSPTDIDKCLSISQDYFPEYVKFQETVANAANVDFHHFFQTFCASLSNNPILSFGYLCTGIAKTTPTGVLLGHNEDSFEKYRENRIFARWDVDGFGTIIGLFYIDGSLSVGMNSFGVGLVGESLFPNDAKVGFPQDYGVAKILFSKSFDQAVLAATDKRRMASYNNIIADKNGRMISVEASGTDLALVKPVNNVLVHTNHFTTNRMKKFEAHPHILNSQKRLQRANQIKNKDLKFILSDHQTRPYAICQHDDNDSHDVTLATTIFNLNKGTMLFSEVNPCLNQWQTEKI